VLAAYLSRFLGYADYQGTCFEEDFVATGYGAYIALPLMRSGFREDLSYEEARKLIEDCMRVMFYRDARASNVIQVANCTNGTVQISEPFELETYGWQSGEAACEYFH
jgi:20S proteasome subunit beta 7